MKRSLLLITAVFFLSILSFGQNIADIKTKLSGKWLLVKHLLTENKKTEDLLTSNEIYTYNFESNGNYQVSYTNKKNESTTVYTGKWQIVSGGKKLKLFDNHIEPDHSVLVNDKLLPIIQITATAFVTKELLFGMDLWGVSYYKKQ